MQLNNNEKNKKLLMPQKAFGLHQRLRFFSIAFSSEHLFLMVNCFCFSENRTLIDIQPNVLFQYENISKYLITINYVLLRKTNVDKKMEPVFKSLILLYLQMVPMKMLL